MADCPLAVVGCGSIGKRHLRNLKHLGIDSLIAVEPSEDRRMEVERELGVVTFSELPAALAHPVRAVLICSPTHLHVEQALTAAQSGCHLFIEKPLSHTLEGLDALEAEVADRRLITLVGCNFHFDLGLRHVKRLLEEGVAGRVVSVRAQFGQYLPDWHPWEDYRHGYSAHPDMGGGVLLDRIHEIGYMRWLLGEITEVGALIGHLSRLEIGSEDTVEILARFASGAFASLHMDYVRRLYDCSLEITGECGTIRWCYQDGTVAWYTASDGVGRQMSWPQHGDEDMYVRQMRHFLRVLEGAETSEQDLREAKRVLEIALAAKRAAVEKRVLPV